MIRKKTKEILVDSFRELAKYNTIDSITVKKIVQNCQFSYATFYRYFNSIYDLITWDYSQNILNLIKNSIKNNHKWKELLLEVSYFYDKEKDFLKKLLLQTVGYESFLRYMRETNISILKYYLKEKLNLIEFDKKINMYIYLYVFGTVQLISEWILGKIELTCDDLVEILFNSIPFPLCKYLCPEIEIF